MWTERALRDRKFFSLDLQLHFRLRMRHLDPRGASSGSHLRSPLEA